MSRRWPVDRRYQDDQPASADVSRFLVLGFLVAALLGLVTGIGWVAYSLVRARFGW